jgi:peptide/nickel transport system substrate-binding protein
VKKLIFIMLMIFLAVSMVCIGCANTTTAPATTPATAPAKTPVVAPTTSPTATSTTLNPQSGGVIKVITTGTITNLGCPGNMAGARDSLYSKACVETLVGFDEQGNGTPVPVLATDWKYSPDYTSLTFSLRKGVKFQDGTDFNADAAKYCLDLTRTSTLPDLKSVTSIDALDEYTIRLNLSSYQASLMSSLVTPSVAMMVSPTAYKAMGANTAKFKPVGTGPYKFVSYTQDVSLKYERFDGYWRGKPYLDGMEFLFISDPVTQLLSFKSGQAQVIISLTPKDAGDMQSTGQYNILGTPAGMIGLAGDSARSGSPFANIKVRQAMAYALDNQKIANVLGYGLYQSTNQIAPPGGYAYNQSVVGYPYNPQKAKQSLSEAGYPNGFSTKISYNTDATKTNLFTAVQGYFSAVGINVQLNPLDNATFTDLKQKQWSDALVWYSVQCMIGFDVGASLMRNLSSSASEYSPKSLYIPDDYTVKLTQASAERDPDKRKAQFQELSKIVTDQYCLVIPIYVDRQSSAQTQQVHDFQIHKYSANDWRPEKAWLSK